MLSRSILLRSSPAVRAGNPLPALAAVHAAPPAALHHVVSDLASISRAIPSQSLLPTASPLAVSRVAVFGPALAGPASPKGTAYRRGRRGESMLEGIKEIVNCNISIIECS